MRKIVCMECGEILTEETKECPKCGCPVNPSQFENKIEKPAKNSKNGIVSVISLIIGMIVIIFGFTLMNHKIDAEIYETRTFDVERAEFGGDFYTEIYRVSDTIVDELNDINYGMGIVSTSIISIMEAIYYGCGVVVVSIGLGIIAISLINISNKKIGM